MILSRQALRSLGRSAMRAAMPAGRRPIVGALGTTSSAAWGFRSKSSTAIANPDMFCRQCEQTKDHFACTTVGICGKSSETAALQDAVMAMVKSVSQYCVAARAAGVSPDVLAKANEWTLKATFSTLTNVNFSGDRMVDFLNEGASFQEDLQPYAQDMVPIPVQASLQDWEAYGHIVSIPALQGLMNHEDCFSLKEIATYGTKGLCAYAAHCHQILGTVDESVMTGIHEVLAQLASDEPDMNKWLTTALRVGELNAQVLAILDGAHATAFGDPEPTEVKLSATEGKAILISGHDLKDLEALLEQTEGTGVNIYTHGEMLSGHSYPGLKKYSHLVGNYGTAWQNQKFEFAGFPGPVIVTTNCILEPRRIYKDRLYTMNQVGVDGVKHIGDDRDFSPVIAQAQEMKGFPRTIEPADYHTVGFNHRSLVPLVDDVIEAHKSGALSRIVLIGGCDGSQWDRNYFTDLAEELPEDTLILTLGCAKNRLIHSEKLLGAKLANGMPRVLDLGQCNDSYSAVVVAMELAKKLDCDINELPLSLALSHLEQKAAAVLLTLLHLGVKNIRLGPSLPAFVSPNVLQVLVQNYNIMPTTDAEADIEQIMSGN